VPVERERAGGVLSADLMCVCISRHVVDGEVLAQGLATPLVAAGYLLAWMTHAPNACFASAIGQSLCQEGAPLGLASVESLWLDRSVVSYGFVSATVDLLPRVRPKEFFRPGQVDPAGNFNNLAFGSDYRHPRMRLPGAGGIPDVTPLLSDIFLYVPRHSRVTFVEKLDFRSGLGHDRRRLRGSGPRYLVSDLGQFDFEGGRMRLTHLHPGVTPSQVLSKTGFELRVADELGTTPLASAEELRLLREVIDPLGIRRLEFLSGPERRKALAEMIAAETQQRAPARQEARAAQSILGA
jgi:acyl CoA:acetate/3-ketoacid CoA transferase beta subunit